MINKKCFNAKVMAVATLAVLCVGCVSTKSNHLKLANISGTRVLVDSRYDAQPDAEATAFLKPYSAKVDSLMSPVVGQTARYMASKRPESELSNLLPDILIWLRSDLMRNPTLLCIMWVAYVLPLLKAISRWAMCSMWHRLKTKFAS